MKKRYYSQHEKLPIFEEVLYNHTYDEDTEMIVRTGYTPVLAILGIILIGVAILIAL